MRSAAVIFPRHSLNATGCPRPARMRPRRGRRRRRTGQRSTRRLGGSPAPSMRRRRGEGMIRALVTVVLMFLVAAAFVWLAERPGGLVLVWQGYEVRTSLM